MKLILLLISLVGLISCKDPPWGDPPCPNNPDKSNSPGIYSRALGSVKIDEQNCQIFETYKTSECGNYIRWDGRKPPSTCVGCREEILTRITKCPTQTTVNSVTQTGGKFNREEIR